MKKVAANFIVLLIAAAGVFFAGWVQLYVKAGSCGILTSKTGGIYKEPVVAGKFLWRWERLLPTNTNLEIFSLESRVIHKNVSGELPSGALYASKVNVGADFSYNIDFDIKMEASPECIHSLFCSNKISSEETLNLWLEEKALDVARVLTDFLLEQSNKKYAAPSSLSAEELEELSAKVELEGAKILSVAVKDAKIPDIELYNLSKKSYFAYQEELDSQLKLLAGQQAETVAKEKRSMQQLEKFANLLKQYPQLESLAKSENFSNIIEALNTAR